MHGRTRRDSARHAHDEEPRAGLAAAARSRGAEGHRPRPRSVSRPPLWRHGGTVFGPQPRSYDFELPKKVERGALRAALPAEAEGRRRSSSSTRWPRREVKTKAAVELLKRLGVTGKAVLVDVAARREASRVGAQHPGVVARASARLTARDVMNARRRVVATRARAREAAGGAGMKLTDVIRRPLITEKTSILREDGRTIVFEVAPEREQDRDQARHRAAARRRRSRASGRASRTARSSGRAASPAAARTGRRPTSRLREGAKMPEFLEGA